MQAKGTLARTGYTFTGWNTAANGSGTSYSAGATFAMGNANVTLYAQWTANPTYTVTYNGNGSTGGTVPVDGGSYEIGTTVTVQEKGTLARTGYTFTGWNTAANGSGTSYAAGATFAMGNANVTLYAQWSASGSFGGSGGSSESSESSGSSYIKRVSTDGNLTLPAGAIGEVSFEDLVKIFIPASATSKELTITIKRDSEAEKLLLKEKRPVSGVFEILKNISEDFNKVITISFAFEPSKLAEGQQPAVFYHDEPKNEWVEVAGGKVDGNWISAEVKHLAAFTVLCVEAGGDQRVPCGPADSYSEPEFSDISGHWAASNIQQAVKKGIVSGYPDGKFKPNHTLMRGEFIVMLINSLKPKSEGAELTFTDSESIPSWARKAVAQAIEGDIIRGYEDGTFRPDTAVTRAEMAAMIAKSLKLTIEKNTETGFADDQLIPNWVKGEAAALQKRGIMEGTEKNQFNSEAKATRAEAVTMLLRILEIRDAESI